ncbi:MAG: glycosyltransferase [Selenomonadaceae bacterium]|nr:glycosyltransferase [Selenomonadaceae bacterium]
MILPCLMPIGGVKYFEKENGGVSTALNLGIKNMRGKYFSWLSHDDVYMPEKVQVEIDALRQVGDMSRVVYSNWSSLKMPEGKIEEFDGTLVYRQEFLETGAFAPLFGFISGCSLLIPKFLFDVYGGFDETFRAVQDYKKWFEMFRGRRLVYVRQSLILSRQHAEQTTHTYSVRIGEEYWLYCWMIYNLHKDDLVGSGLTDLYHLYSALFTKWFGNGFFQHAFPFIIQKIMELPESPDADERVKKFDSIINGKKFKTYFPKEQEDAIRFHFSLRGVKLGVNVKFIPFENVANLKLVKNDCFLTIYELIQLLLDTPIRKKLFAEWLNSQEGQQA